MHINRRTMLKVGGGLAMAGAFGTRLAHAAPKTWDFADEYTVNLLPGHATQFFIAEIEKRIGDELKVIYQGGGSLGYKSNAHFDAVESGAVPMAITGVTQISGIDPFFEISSIPFLVKDGKESKALWEVSSPEYSKVFEQNNQIVLYGVPSPPAGVHSLKALDRPEALDGLRIRTWDAIGTRALRQAGAAPLQIAWSDVVPQLSTGALDALLTSPDGGASISVWEYLKHFTLFSYSMSAFCAHVNRDSFETLSKNAQDELLKIGKETTDYAWSEMDKLLEKGLSTLEANGMTVVRTPDAATFARLQEAGNVIKDDWVQKVGPRAEEVLAKLEAAIKA